MNPDHTSLDRQSLDRQKNISFTIKIYVICIKNRCLGYSFEQLFVELSAVYFKKKCIINQITNCV